MNIGALGKRTGLTTSRIRFYERAGLLSAVQRLPNGYRDYPESTVTVLQLITSAQSAGFSLEEIRALLPASSGRWEHDALLVALRRKIADIEAMERRLAHSKSQLRGIIADIEAKPGDLTCTDNAQRVLARVIGDVTAPASPSGARTSRGKRAD